MRAARGIVLCVVCSKDRQVLKLVLRNRAVIVKEKALSSVHLLVEAM